MAKRAKGLSFDQKRQKMLNFFHATKQVLNMNDIEKLSQKNGITFQSVKEVLDSLLADDLVISDKIGAGNFYWSFPSKTYQILVKKIEQSKGKISSLNEQISQLKKQTEAANIGRQETEQRAQTLAQLKRLKQRKKSLEDETQKYRRFDPERVELEKKQINELVRKTNEQTDNIHQLIGYLKKVQPLISNETLKQGYELDPQTEYIDQL